MVSLTLKIILHTTENDSKYRDVAPLNFDQMSFYFRSSTRKKVKTVRGKILKWRSMHIVKIHVLFRD